MNVANIIDWQPIESAPKGTSYSLLAAERIEPPEILLWFPLLGWNEYDGTAVVGAWDWDLQEWYDVFSGETISDHYDAPTHWSHIQAPQKKSPRKTLRKK